ncbi:SLC13 family permease [Sinomicrobium sp. M5D2P9]
MTLEIAVVLGILILAVVLFATEKIRVDLVALLVVGLLLICDILLPVQLLTTEEAVSGFSNTATVTVAAMFVISAALAKTGSINFLGSLLAKLIHKNFYLAATAIMLCAGIISAFINNTPVVAVFMPIIIGAAKDSGISPSKLLMPLSFASMFGGLCTLIGTSTNILVSSIAEGYGITPFRMFDFAPLGIVFFICGMLYMLFAGIRLIPDRVPETDLTKRYEMRNYLTEIVLTESSSSVGKTILDSPLVKDMDIDIIALYRDKRVYSIPGPGTVLREGDILRVRCDVEKIRELQDSKDVELRTDKAFMAEDFKPEDIVLLEAVIAPNSILIGTTLKKIRFRNRFGATTLAIRHMGGLVHEKLGNIVLRSGDTLLIGARETRIDQLKRNPNFVFVTEVDTPEYRKNKTLIVLSIIAAVVTTASLGILPIMTGAIVGCILLVLSGCIDLDDAYKAVDWKVIFLLAGAISLGVALERTGAAKLLADYMLSVSGPFGPYAIVAAFYLLTSLLTEAMSNNATAVVMVPIAISAANAMDASAIPLLMAIAYAASASFMTPVGYQTNTLIYGPGQYKFADFIKVGAPLNLIFFIIATIAIPLLWPF